MMYRLNSSLLTRLDYVGCQGAEGQRRALAVASLLADLGMDCEAVAVGLLAEAVADELIPLSEVAPIMGMQVRTHNAEAHTLHPALDCAIRG
jgi:hypothetical protein